MSIRTLTVVLAGIVAIAVSRSNIQAQTQQPVGGFVTRTTTSQPARPWDLDLHARLERRFDKSLQQAGPTATGLGTRLAVPDFVDGSISPELLLPWELHQFLLSTAFYSDEPVASAWRRRFQNANPVLGVTDEFWAKLDDVSAEFLRDQRDITIRSNKIKTLRPEAASEQYQAISAIEKTQCYKRMQALERANTAFGQEWFAKFLYLSVAPNLKISTTSPITANRHLFISRGCQ